ncbi:TIGR04452 family lipoprotein [Leptospira sarikeiensis]|uniref:TIGR04452 family lipoprotein n=1 Tax=Leptospira sarikeiensis TaxID=2484943 RepID=A0A4R9K5F0_9LEPT|nr:TIGR04452 family lipoprotein [Leptospira sarikeiensis]TGL59497.1 TIGR04452 family lipoprotein [Leptospira sarikeiensis]
MSKKILFQTSLLCSAFFANCVILNPIGLTVDRIKGSEAASRISDAAITAEILNHTLRGVPTTAIPIGVLLAPMVAGINSDSYYKKSDVENCVDNLIGFKAFATGVTFTLATSCKLDADGSLF